MASIEFESFPGQQMRGNGIAAEGIQRKQIEMLPRFIFHRKPRIPRHNFDLRWRASQVSKLVVSHSRDFRVDFIKLYMISRAAKCRHGSSTQPNDTNPPRSYVHARNRQGNSTLLRVIS